MGSCTTYDPASASFEDFDYNASEVTTLCFLPEAGDTSPDGLLSLQPCPATPAEGVKNYTRPSLDTPICVIHCMEGVGFPRCEQRELEVEIEGGLSKFTIPAYPEKPWRYWRVSCEACRKEFCDATFEGWKAEEDEQECLNWYRKEFCDATFEGLKAEED